MATRPAGSAAGLGAFASHLACTWDDAVSGPGAPHWQLREGSLLKVDLSGFTRLSERLALASRTGAEELSGVLDAVLSVLAEQALARGGDVVQFGGDALLVWFERAEHRARALAAAQAMHAAVRLRPAERTPAGVVRLRMSAGAASGEVLFGIVGGGHRELVVLGPVASAATRLESAARAGQTLVGPPASLVRRAPAHAPVPTTPVGTGAAGAFLAPDVRVLAAAGTVGEHRRCAVAFARLSGTDALVTGHGPGAALGAVRSVTEAVEEAVRDTGVCWTATDLAADGVVWLLYAGAPVARDGDEERMVRACRAILDRTAGLPVHVGANHGRVFAGTVGHPRRRAYALLGDATNVAARLMALAPARTALVSRDLWDRSARDHDVTWQPPLAARGRRRPVEHVALGGRLRRRPGAAESHAVEAVRVLGRQAELDLLAELVGGVGSGRANPLALVGEAGVGKTRLLAAARRQAVRHGLRVVHATGSALEQAQPYGALRASLRAALALEDLDPAEAGQRLERWAGEDAGLVPLLGLPLGLDLPGTAEVAALDPRFVSARRDALLTAVLLRAGAEPLLVAVEDLHVLDRASLGWLDTLVQASATAAPPLGVLVASRTGLDGLLAEPARWAEHRLGPLDPASARALVLAEVGDAPLSDLDLGRVLDQAAGNPLFLTELARFAGRAGAEDLPERADAVIAAGIDRLPLPERTLLREASVAGASAPLDWDPLESTCRHASLSIL